MTLSVSAYIRHPDGRRESIHLPSDLAGLEDNRTTFYGSERSVRLGLKLLPQLRDSDLTVCGAELSNLLAEVAILSELVPPGIEGDYWRFRLNNIKVAIERASEHGDAGCVWIA